MPSPGPSVASRGCFRAVVASAKVTSSATASSMARTPVSSDWHQPVRGHFTSVKSDASHGVNGHGVMGIAIRYRREVEAVAAHIPIVETLLK